MSGVLRGLSAKLSFLGYSRTFGCDAAGNQTLSVDRNAVTRTFTYDHLNRQTTETWLSSGLTTKTFTSAYDVKGQLRIGKGEIGKGDKYI